MLFAEREEEKVNEKTAVFLDRLESFLIDQYLILEVEGDFETKHDVMVMIGWDDAKPLAYRLLFSDPAFSNDTAPLVEVTLDQDYSLGDPLLRSALDEIKIPAGRLAHYLLEGGDGKGGSIEEAYALAFSLAANRRVRTEWNEDTSQVEISLPVGRTSMTGKMSLCDAARFLTFRKTGSEAEDDLRAEYYEEARGQE